MSERERRYAVKEWFPTLQGEGALAGRRAVFLRLAGCNAWNGVPADRDNGKGDCARWCDTDFVGGQKMTAGEIVATLELAWNAPFGNGPTTSRMVVITGGEPTLQLDHQLVKALHDQAWFIAVETNGSVVNKALNGVDHICVSPKRGLVLEQRTAHELKVVLPGGWTFDEVRTIWSWGMWGQMFVQPQDATDPAFVGVTHLSGNRLGDTGAGEYAKAVETCVEFIKQHPGWRLSMQQHKYLGLR